jgi:hypothetical protein
MWIGLALTMAVRCEQVQAFKPCKQGGGEKLAPVPGLKRSLRLMKSGKFGLCDRQPASPMDQDLVGRQHMASM